MRAVSNWNTGFPHMRGGITPRAATVAELLRAHGYATYAAGKWHLAPMAETSAAGPHTNWPLQKGFDRFYGFLQGETDQFFPELTHDNHHIDPPGRLEDGYHVSEDIVEHSIGWVRDLVSVRPDRPFFLYLAFGATHAPHQSPESYRARWRGKFDEGYDVARQRFYERQLELGIIPKGTTLAPRNPGVPPWDDLLMVVSDNGASREGGPFGVMDEFSFFNGQAEDVDRLVAERLDDIGGPHSHSNYPWGWAQAGNSPLRWYKQNTYGGGVRDPLVVHWPERVEQTGELRTQFCHAIDIAATILDATAAPLPEQFGGVAQIPLHGRSIVPTFNDAGAPSPRTVQYFEQMGHRGIVADGWKATTYHEQGSGYGEERLRKLIDLWWSEAGEMGVLPLDDRTIELFGGDARPGSPHARSTYRYLAPISHIPADASPTLGGRAWTITADVDVDVEGQPHGVLYARGSHNVGHTFFLGDGALVFDYNALTTGPAHRWTSARAATRWWLALIVTAPVACSPSPPTAPTWRAWPSLGSSGCSDRPAWTSGAMPSPRWSTTTRVPTRSPAPSNR